MHEKLEIEVLAEIRDLLSDYIKPDHPLNKCGDMVCAGSNYECVTCMVKQVLIQYDEMSLEISMLKV